MLRRRPQMPTIRWPAPGSTLMACLAVLLAGTWTHDASADKKTVCTITVNSADEKEAFRRSLPPDKFQFVELVERGRPDWLASACGQRIRCDVLRFLCCAAWTDCSVQFDPLLSIGDRRRRERACKLEVDRTLPRPLVDLDQRLERFRSTGEISPRHLSVLRRSAVARTEGGVRSSDPWP